MSRALATLALLAVLGGGGVAWADNASEAELQYTLGVELYKQRRYEEALQHFIASNRLVPNANVAFNVAQTFQLLKRDVEAFNWFETARMQGTLHAVSREKAEAAQAELAKKLGVLDLSTTPAGAELFVDRKELGSVGLSPRRLAVLPGPHAVVAAKPGFQDAKTDATAVAGQVQALALTLEAKVGVLVVESTPAGATVRRSDDGQVLGTTPLRLSLPLGPLSVVVALPDYVEQERTLTVREDAEARAQVTLAQAASTVAVLTVQGAPPGARVRVDGKDLGAVPLSLPGLKPGSFQLTVEADGHDAFAAPLLLEPGAATRVEVSLASPAQDRARWLRWVGYGLGGGALLAGLSLGAVAISSRAAFFEAPTTERLRTVQTLNTTADVLLVSGLVTTGVTLLLDWVLLPKPKTKGTVHVVR